MFRGTSAVAADKSMESTSHGADKSRSPIVASLNVFNLMAFPREERLLVTQCVDWIQTRRPPCGIVTEANAYQRRKDEGNPRSR